MTTTDDLFAAIQSDDAAKIKSLLTAEPALATARNEKGLSAVLFARYSNRLKALAALLAAKPHLDIFEAAAAGEQARVQELLERDPALARAAAIDGGTALHLAAYFRHAEIAQALIRAGADVNAVAPGFGNVQPLHSAAAGHQLSIVKMLLEAAANPNARQHMGYTALHEAANSGDVEMARLLLKYGADPAAQTDTGQTALAIAEEKGKSEVATLLREARPPIVASS